MTIICSIILFTTWSFSFLNAVGISKLPGHYINHRMQYSTARTSVILLLFWSFMIMYGTHTVAPTTSI